MSSNATLQTHTTELERSRFHERMVGHAIMFIILPILLGAGAVIVINNYRTFGDLRTATESQLSAETSVIARRIGHQNRDAIVTAQRMAEAQSAGMFGDRRSSTNYARLVLESSKQFTAAYFCYEPNADGNDAASLDTIDAEAMDESGRFLPYLFRSASKGDTIELEPAVDMDTSLYYDGVKKAYAENPVPAPLITEPYVYRGKMIVEQTYPIVIDGKFAGVAGVDRALADVERELHQLSDDFNADAFLVSSRGKFIAATVDDESDSAGQLKTRAVADTPYRTLFDELLNIEGNRHVVVTEDPTDGERYYFAAEPIATGGWYLVMRDSEEKIVAPVWARIRMSLLLAILFLAGITVLMVSGIVRISRRVNAAAVAAKRVADGDLAQDTDPGRGRDETSMLLRAIGAMTGNLNGLIGSVRKAGIQLHSTATELAATSREQEATASSFGASANQIAAAVKEISATGAELLHTMGDVNSVATKTATLATEGRTDLQGMENTMRGLDEATGSIAQKLAVINEKASNITGVVTTITKVAEQTNLLSVNAAIEAEKAGEYGVGFLVVAREIRRLADQTATATLDIERMVQQMQSAVSSGVMEMDRFSDQVRHSVKDVAAISQQMGKIIEQVNANTNSFDRVNEGMRSQSQGADQISEAMEQLTANAVRTSEAIREYAQAADSLQGSIGSLKNAISSFKLKS